MSCKETRSLETAGIYKREIFAFKTFKLYTAGPGQGGGRGWSREGGQPLLGVHRGFSATADSPPHPPPGGPPLPARCQSASTRLGGPAAGSSTDPPSSNNHWGARHSFPAKRPGSGSPPPSGGAWLNRCSSPSHLGRALAAPPAIQPVPPPGCSFRPEDDLQQESPQEWHSCVRALQPFRIQSPLGWCHPTARMRKWRHRDITPLSRVARGTSSSTLLSGVGGRASFPGLPTSHFSYLRETWPHFPTVNV